MNVNNMLALPMTVYMFKLNPQLFFFFWNAVHATTLVLQNSSQNIWPLRLFCDKGCLHTGKIEILRIDVLMTILAILRQSNFLVGTKVYICQAI